MMRPTATKAVESEMCLSGCAMTCCQDDETALRAWRGQHSAFAADDSERLSTMEGLGGVASVAFLCGRLQHTLRLFVE